MVPENKKVGSRAVFSHVVTSHFNPKKAFAILATAYAGALSACSGSADVAFDNYKIPASEAGTDGVSNAGSGGVAGNGGTTTGGNSGQSGSGGNINTGGVSGSGGNTIDSGPVTGGSSGTGGASGSGGVSGTGGQTTGGYAGDSGQSGSSGTGGVSGAGGKGGTTIDSGPVTGGSSGTGGVGGSGGVSGSGGVVNDASTEDSAASGSGGSTGGSSGTGGVGGNSGIQEGGIIDSATDANDGGQVNPACISAAQTYTNMMFDTDAPFTLANSNYTITYLGRASAGIGNMKIVDCNGVTVADSLTIRTGQPSPSVFASNGEKITVVTNIVGVIQASITSITIEK
jgi:hypothetical protein